MNMKLKSILLILIGFVTLTGCVTVTNSERQESDVLKKDTIKVGMELEYAPFETIDQQGKPYGFSVAYAERLAASLGKKVEIVPTKYDALIPSLENKSIDMIISSMSVTNERKQRVDFSESYTTPALYALTSENAQVSDLKQIDSENITVAVKTGTLSAYWVAENAPKAHVKSFESMDAALLDVASGQSQVAIYDPITIYSFQEKHKQTKIITTPISNINGWGIALPKGDAELKAKVDAFVRQAKTDGTAEQLKQTYLQDEMNKFNKYGIPFIL